MSYKARRRNRELTIPEEKAEEYAQMGYSVTDAEGNVVAEADITSVADAKKEMEVFRKENAELKAKLEETMLYAENADKKIEQLQEENAELKKAAKEPAPKATKTSRKPE